MLVAPEVESGLGVVLPLSPEWWTSAQPLSGTSGPRLVRATENLPFPAGSRIGAPRSPAAVARAALRRCRRDA